MMKYAVKSNSILFQITISTHQTQTKNHMPPSTGNHGNNLVPKSNNVHPTMTVTGVLKHLFTRQIKYIYDDGKIIL